jgi:hypothetical protein
MGSELFDAGTDPSKEDGKGVIWLDLGIFCNDANYLRYSALSPKGSSDLDGLCIYGRTTMKYPYPTSHPYQEFLAKVDAFPFCYDWRESIPLEAEKLYNFLRMYFSATEEEKQLNIVTHSMGGCLLLTVLQDQSKRSFLEKKLGKIILCTPPIHGALPPLRAVEYGTLEVTILDAIKRREIARSCATMPGLFQLLVSDRKQWPSRNNNQDYPDELKKLTELEYPIRVSDGDNTPYTFYSAKYWQTKHKDYLPKLLRFAYDFHERKHMALRHIVEDLGERMFILCGANGRTPYAAEYKNSSVGWVLRKPSEDKSEKRIYNGDGTVLLQSSLIPKLNVQKYFVYVPTKTQETHHIFMDIDSVCNAVNTILSKTSCPKKLKDLTRLDSLVASLYLEEEKTQSIPKTSILPEQSTSYGYRERRLIRQELPYHEWSDADKEDALLYYLTKEAAERVLRGNSDIETESRRIHQSKEFLEEHLRHMINLFV